MKSKTFNRESQLVEVVKKILKDNKINFFKVHGNVFQSGLPDLLVFNSYTCYGLELKTDFSKNEPSPLQIGRAKQFRNNLIVIFVDKNNYKEVLNKVIENNFNWLEHNSKKQLDYWNTKYETTL